MAPSTKIINAGLRAFLFVFTVISLGVEGHLRASNYDTARVNMGIASSVIGLVFSVFASAIILFIESLYNVLILLGLDFISFVLYLSASASLTAQRNTCHEPGRGMCSQFRAGIAFLYMDWIILFFAMLLELYQLFAEQRGLRSSTYPTPFDYNTRQPASNLPRTTEQPVSDDHVSPISTANAKQEPV